MRIIDANAFRKELDEYVFPITENNMMGAADAYYRTIHLLDEFPAADAEPVRHARWVDEYNGEHKNHPKYRCSSCKGKALYKIGRNTLGNVIREQARTKFCPYCGKKMDLEGV